MEVEEKNVEKAFLEVFTLGRCLYLISVSGVSVASSTYLNQKEMVCVCVCVLRL